MRCPLDFSRTDKVQIVEVAPRDGFQAVKNRYRPQSKVE